MNDAPSLRKTSLPACSICFEKFCSKPMERHPFVGQCGHSFCKECSSGLQALGKCPTCRAAYKPAKNYTFIAYFEEVNRTMKQKIRLMRNLMFAAGMHFQKSSDGETDDGDGGADSEEQYREGFFMLNPMYVEYSTAPRASNTIRPTRPAPPPPPPRTTATRTRGNFIPFEDYFYL